MFSKVSDASKIAFVFLSNQLEKWGYELIDCQVYTSHLESLGAYMMPRDQFITLLEEHAIDKNKNTKWQIDHDLSDIVISNIKNKSTMETNNV